MCIRVQNSHTGRVCDQVVHVILKTLRPVTLHAQNVSESSEVEAELYTEQEEEEYSKHTVLVFRLLLLPPNPADKRSGLHLT